VEQFYRYHATAKHVTDIETGIANNVVQNVEDAGQIAAIFK